MSVSERDQWVGVKYFLVSIKNTFNPIELTNKIDKKRILLLFSKTILKAKIFSNISPSLQ